MPPKKPIVTSDKPLEGVWDDTWVNPGKLIWVELPIVDKGGDVFLPGTIKSYDATTKKAEVEYEGEKKGQPTVRIDKFVERSDKWSNLADLVDIEMLNDAELLYSMLRKFQIYDIFTYCGPTLLVTNPISPKLVTHFFTDEVMLGYAKLALKDSFNVKDSPPHIWAVSALTYWQLFANQRKQAICISGESGAGKTVNAKFSMKFLTYMSSVGEEKPKDSTEESIEDKILGCNPILEAFGNSRTVKNDNSSRFGKYVALICKVGKGKSDSKIIGAATTNYLLEKSRIVQQAKTERNYHIFYQCMYGLPPETLRKYNFENNPPKYEILKKSECFKVDTVDDVKEFKEVTDSFVKMSFSEEEVDIVYSIVGAVLNLGNVELDDTEVSNSNPYLKVSDKDTFLPLACQNTGMDTEKIKKGLSRVLFVVQGKSSEKAIDKVTALQLRDSLAKDLFEKLFNWLVKRLNVTIMPAEDKALGGGASNKKDRYTIGLLDIFGFEIFQRNSLEQFCINFTNENLHQLYIAYVFKAEEVVFREEGLGDVLGKELTFNDNQHIIDMLSKGKESIISLLNETTKTATNDGPKNDNKFLANIKQFNSKQPNFKLDKFKNDTFIIVHTARDVEYTIWDFVAKNQDSLSPLLVDCILSSTKRQLIRVYKNILSDEEDKEEVEDEDKNKKFLAYKFNQQMYDLMDELKSCECNFMRCIKPNEEKVVGKWDPALAIGQIRYLGILDSIKVRKTSYPFRKDFKSFYRRYIDLDPVGSRQPFKKHEENPNTNWKALCKAVHQAAIPEFGDSQILFGNTKTFLRFEANLRLEQIYKEKLQKKKKAIETLGPYITFFKHKSMFMSVTIDTIKLTKILRDLVIGWRSKILYRKFRLLKNYITRIQRKWRFKLFFRNLRYLKNSAKIIVPTLQCLELSAKRKKQKSAAAMINRIGRGYIARMERREKLKFKIMAYQIFEDVWVTIEARIRQNSAVMIQKHFRGYLTRKQNKDLVDKIKKSKEDFLFNSSATKIQKIVKGRIQRKRYLRILASTRKIQGFFMMRWLSAMFQRLRKSAIKIQIRIRRYLARKMAKDKRMKGYMKKEGNILYDIQELEHACLIDFASGLKESDRKEKVSGVKQEMHDGFLLSAIPDKSRFPTQKLYLWMYILDIECTTDLTDVYDPIWAEQYKTLCVEIGKRTSELQMLDIGSMHSMTISNKNRLYSWGMNDYGQLSRDTPHFEDESYTVDLVSVPKRGNTAPRIKNFACGDDHAAFVSKDGEIFVTGRNDKGQLGLGNDKDVSEFTLHETLTKVDIFKVVVAKGYHSVAIGESGAAYYWPAKLSALETLNEPIRLNFPEETKITMASCGFDFVMLLTSKGVLYSMGRNIEGQLGHGLKREDQPEPRPIEHLLNEKQKISSVSCGFRHTAALGTNGKVFTWGWGDRGQLGNGTKYSFSEPRQVKFPSTVVMSKVIQVRSSYRSCIALMEDLNMYWWGTNGSMRQELLPIKIKRSELNDDNLIPAKVVTAWSKSMNVTYCTIVDSRRIEISKPSKMNIISNLASSWENCHQDGKNLGTSPNGRAERAEAEKQLKAKIKNSGTIKDSLSISGVALKFESKLKASQAQAAYQKSQIIKSSQPLQSPQKSQDIMKSTIKQASPKEVSTFMTPSKSPEKSPIKQDKPGFSSPPEMVTSTIVSGPSELKTMGRSQNFVINHKGQASVFDQHKKALKAKAAAQASTGISPQKVQNKIIKEATDQTL